MAAATPKSPAIGQAQRFDPHSSKSVMVFVLAGHSSRVAVDFVLGRGWYSGRNGAARWREPSEVLFNTVSGEVEQAFLNAPISALVALAADPLKHFEYTDLLCAHKYVMEHRLCQWICSQNQVHGLAPSRQQILEQALFHIPAEAPEQIRASLTLFVTGAPRKQRKWLARFRRRWGARIGVLSAREDVPIPIRKKKAC